MVNHSKTQYIIFSTVKGVSYDDPIRLLCILAWSQYPHAKESIKKTEMHAGIGDDCRERLNFSPSMYLYKAVPFIYAL